MRHLLTFVAVTLVAALCAALVVPLLIDWTARRAAIEAQLTAMTGADARVDGAIDLRLLPTPYLLLSRARLVGKAQGAPTVSFESARLELSPIKLMSGRFLFTEARFERPILTLSRAADGELRLPPRLPATRAEAVGVERLVVHDGRLRLIGPGADEVREVGGIDLDLSAPSLYGPFRGSGEARLDGAAAPLAFHVVSGPLEAAGTSVKAAIEAGPGSPTLELDGALAAAPGAADGSSALSYAGSATLSGLTVPAGDAPPLPWRLSGALKADFRKASIDAADLRFGPDEKALAASGPVRLVYGWPAQLSAALVAKPLNLDGLLRRKDEDGVAPARALADLAAALAPLVSGEGRAASVALDVSAPSLVLGGETLGESKVTTTFAGGGPIHARFDLGLPGRGRLTGEGEFERGAAAAFRGRVALEAPDFERLRGWAGMDAPALAGRLAALADILPYHSASASGAVELSAVSLAARDVSLTLDRTRLSGALAYSAAVGGERARFYADLSTASLDVDGLPRLDASAPRLADLDLTLALRAGALHVDRVGAAEVEGGSLTLRLAKSGPNLTLDRLSIADLGGANVEAKGAIDANGAALEGRLEATRLGDFASLLARVAPGEATRRLVERAAALSPTRLRFEARGGAGGASLTALKAEGTVGETQLQASLEAAPAGPGRKASFALDAPDGSALLRQFGLGGAARPSGKAHVAASALGGFESGFDAEATGSLAGAELAWRGKVKPAASADDAWFYGPLSLKGADIAPLLQALAAAPVGVGAVGPADFAADLTLRGDRATLSRLTGSFAGAKVAGALAYRRAPPVALPATLEDADMQKAREIAGETAEALPDAPPPAEIEGELSFDRLALSGLLGFELGAPQAAKPGARWSDGRFAPPPYSGPSAAVKLAVGALDLGEAGTAQGFSGMLRLGRGRLDLEDMTMRLGGGALSGRATLRRSGATASLTGAVKAEDLVLARPGLAGRVGGGFDFASTGVSAAALAEGVAGGGTLRLAGVSLAKADLGALERVVARAQAPDALVDETNVAHAFATELDRRAASLPDGETPLAISAGQARIGPIAIARPGGEATASASFDLRTLGLETRVGVSAAAPAKFWFGPPPSASFAQHEGGAAAGRQVDVAQLAAGLSAQAIARESDRIANLEADIRERAYFNRRMKAEKFLALRAAELAAWAEDQARLKSLAERRHAEAEAERVAAEKAAAEKAAAEKFAAEKAAAEKAAAEKAAAEKAAAEKAAAEKTAAEKAAAEKAAAEKAAAEKDAADKAALEKAAADKAAAEKMLGLRPSDPDLPPPQDVPGASDPAAHLGEPAPATPPAKPRRLPGTPADPTASGLY